MIPGKFNLKKLVSDNWFMSSSANQVLGRKSVKIKLLLRFEIVININSLLN